MIATDRAVSHVWPLPCSPPCPYSRPRAASSPRPRASPWPTRRSPSWAVPGSVRTDAEGRFRWTPDPRPPFEVLIVLPGGGYVKPILVEELTSSPLVLEVAPALAESVMVVAGAAPSVEAAPANGVTLVPEEDLRSRQPVHVAQAVENVAGTATISEGQAAVPVVRGLASGRTLILLDGARVTPSAASARARPTSIRRRWKGSRSRGGRVPSPTARMRSAASSSSARVGPRPGHPCAGASPAPSARARRSSARPWISRAGSRGAA